jgi:hypothetical protein
LIKNDGIADLIHENVLKYKIRSRAKGWSSPCLDSHSGSPYNTVMLQKGCFAASTPVMTHQEAQFNKMKSKQQIKIQNTNRQPANPPPTSAGDHATGQHRRTENQLSGRKKSASPACFLSTKNSFLSPNPRTQHHRPEKNQKKLRNRKNQQNQKKKQNPNSKSFLAK